jgi:hypothetical protein
LQVCDFSAKPSLTPPSVTPCSDRSQDSSQAANWHCCSKTSRTRAKHSLNLKRSIFSAKIRLKDKTKPPHVCELPSLFGLGTICAFSGLASGGGAPEFQGEVSRTSGKPASQDCQIRNG